MMANSIIACPRPRWTLGRRTAAVPLLASGPRGLGTALPPKAPARGPAASLPIGGGRQVDVRRPIRNESLSPAETAGAPRRAALLDEIPGGGGRRSEGDGARCGPQGAGGAVEVDVSHQHGGG